MPELTVFKNLVDGREQAARGRFESFDDEEEACALANDTRCGLEAGLCTSDIGRAIRRSQRLQGSQRLQAGTVWIITYRAVRSMAPFGWLRLAAASAAASAGRAFRTP